MTAAPTDTEMGEYVTTHADSDLQFIPHDSAVSLRVQHQIAQGYPTLKRFSASRGPDSRYGRDWLRSY